MAERVEVKKLPNKDQAKPLSVKRRLARLCYFYPQYSLSVARDLPARDVVLLLNEAATIEASRHLAELQIAQAVQAEKPDAAQQLSDHYRGIMNGSN